MTDRSPRPPRLDPSRVRGIVFDLDGTLVDSYQAIGESVNHARAAFSMPPLDPAVIRATVGRGLECLMADLLGPERVAEGVRLFRERYAEVFREMTVALPGARETVRRLAERGFGLAVASNKPARFGRPIVEYLGMGDAIRVVHGPDSAGATKPEPTMLRRCMHDLGRTPAETVYVGDMLLDIRSAAMAGVPVVLVAGGSSSSRDLEASGEILLADLGALEALLQENRSEFTVRSG